MSDEQTISRRDVLIKGSTTVAGMALIPWSVLAKLYHIKGDEKVIPWSDPPPDPAIPDMNLLNWEHLDSWITPAEKFFRASHYGVPEIDPDTYRLEITGLVKRSRFYTLRELKALPRREIDFTLECSGNRGFPWFLGGVYNARWTGTPLAHILEEAGVLDHGIEVVFFGSDEGEEEVEPFLVEPVAMKQNFARSMSLEDAMNPNGLLSYAVNGQPLPRPNGFPVRLIAPGWYGIANVKWLKRIEVRATRFMGRFMAKDYVTIREEVRNGESVWVQTSVGRGLLNSASAKVTHQGGRYRIYGAAWGAPIRRVEVRIDDSGWVPAQILEGQDSEFSWRFWRLEWEDAARGVHAISSRAIDTAGNIQPAIDDPSLTRKRTYWESNGQLTRKVHIR
ncbi:MAG: sulfite oxidase [Candidatus Neomarinimicrobiota bacterium]